jgi:hypothetical protein
MGAKAVGTSHLRAGKGCEDHFDSVTLPNSIQVLAVADGAGSATRAADGARAVVAAALDVAQRELIDGGIPDSENGWTDLLYAVLDGVRHTVEALTISSLSLLPGDVTPDFETQPLQIAVPMRDYAATLLLSIVSPEWIGVLQLGDGMIVIETEGGEYRCPLPPSHDSQYINDTHFITDSNYRTVAQCSAVQASGLHGIALLTDGLQVLASNMTTQEPHPPFFKPLFAFASQASATSRELEAFLDSDRVCQRTDDDKTLVLAVRK